MYNNQNIFVNSAHILYTYIIYTHTNQTYNDHDQLSKMQQVNREVVYSPICATITVSTANSRHINICTLNMTIRHTHINHGNRNIHNNANINNITEKQLILVEFVLIQKFYKKIKQKIQIHIPHGNGQISIIDSADKK